MIRTQRLQALIDAHGGLIQTGPFGSQLHESDYTEDGVPVVMPKDIVEGRINEHSVARIPEAKAAELSRHALKEGNIVFPRRGEISKCALISADETGYLCGTGCLKIELPIRHYNPRFLYYYLGLRHVVEWLERNAVGTTMLNLNTSILGNVQIPSIELEEQDGIAEILHEYDDLIENNRRRIQLLEESTKLLYREWFVHFRFPGHEHVKAVDGIPEEWTSTKLGEIVSLHYGKALKDEDRVPGEFPVYGSSGVVGYHESAMADGPGIIVGRKGNVGTIHWSEKPFNPIDTTYYIEAKESSLFLYYALLTLNFTSSDAAVPGLNRDHAYRQDILMPDSRIRTAFEDCAATIHNQIAVLARGIAKLREARDLLLPRLMSGDLSV